VQSYASLTIHENPRRQVEPRLRDGARTFAGRSFGATDSKWCSRFEEGIDDTTFHGHVCRFAEGKYAGWFGWPNLTMKARGSFLGMPACHRRVEMRVVDMYRREGDRLAENWVFIDLLYFLKQQGLDVLERTKQVGRR